MTNSGNILLLNRRKGGWFSNAQRFFTNKPYTHCALSAGNILSVESIFSADETMDMIPLQNYLAEDSTDIEIYEVKNVEPEVLDSIMKDMYLEYAGKGYGFLQLLWFVYRWANEKLGRDVRLKKNWFTDNLICSEMGYVFLTKVSTKLEKYHSYALITELNKTTPDTCHAGDIADLIHALPEIFNLTYRS